MLILERPRGLAAYVPDPDPAAAAWCWPARPRAIPTGGVFLKVKIPRTGYFKVWSSYRKDRSAMSAPVLWGLFRWFYAAITLAGAAVSFLLFWVIILLVLPLSLHTF